MTMMKKSEKNPHAVALGQKGGRARMHKLTTEQRREIAKMAALARWAKVKKSKDRKKEQQTD